MRGLRITFIIIALAGVFVAGAFTGGFVQNTYVKLIGYKPVLTEETQNKTDLLFNVWSILENRHYDSEDINSQEVLFSAIEGLAEGYNDPYTVFFPPAESEEFSTEIKGEFSGVGMEIGVDDGVLVVVAPLKESPAEKAGVRTGDKIIFIDEELTQGFSIEDAVDRIRGPRGEEVVLTVLHEGASEPEEISIIRDVIDFPTLDTEIIDDVFVLSLYNFNEKAGNQFLQGYQEFLNSDTNKLVLDLRQNPGGFLKTSIDIASYFLPRGSVVVKESFAQGDIREDRDYRSSGKNELLPEDFQMVVLIDGGSASASEILAGALSESGIAKLLGRQTFGKGSVQEFIELSEGTSLKFTVAKWYTPKGNKIDEVGLTPDFEVAFDFEKYQEDETDTQIEAAIRYLNGDDITNLLFTEETEENLEQTENKEASEILEE